jgi:hypothetical protein
VAGWSIPLMLLSLGDFYEYFRRRLRKILKGRGKEERLSVKKKNKTNDNN